MKETDLVQGLRERDPAAVHHLNECWLPSVWRFVYVRVGRDQHLAEDIVSETMLALIKAAGKPEVEINNLGGWLRTVAGNKVNDHFRAAARVQHLIDQVLQKSETNTDDDPASRQELEEQRTEVRNVMDQLPDQYRIALEWKYIEKLSVRDIASRMSVTEKSVESILFRARREFRGGMSIYDDDSGSGSTETGQQGVSDSSKPAAKEGSAGSTCTASAHSMNDAVEADKASK